MRYLPGWGSAYKSCTSCSHSTLSGLNPAQQKWNWNPSSQWHCSLLWLSSPRLFGGRLAPCSSQSLASAGFARTGCSWASWWAVVLSCCLCCIYLWSKACGLKYLNSLFSCFSLRTEAKGEFWELHGPAGERGRRSGAQHGARGGRAACSRAARPVPPGRAAVLQVGRPQGAVPLLLGYGSAACPREAALSRAERPHSPSRHCRALWCVRGAALTAPGGNAARRRALPALRWLFVRGMTEINCAEDGGIAEPWAKSSTGFN